MNDVLPLLEPGEPVGWEPEDEAEHFMLCPACHQPIDCRDLGAVLHHETQGHHRLKSHEATRMVTSEALRDALIHERWKPGAAITH